MRRKLVIFGNCQAAALHQAIREVDQGERFDDVVLFPHMQNAEDMEASLPSYANADIILTQDSRWWDTHPMNGRLPPTTQVIRFPPLGFFALWPYDGAHCGPDPAWAARPRLFGYSDHLMGRLRGSIPDPAGVVSDPEERLWVYKTLNWPNTTDPERLLAFQKRYLSRQDEKIGSRIGRFVVDNARSLRLFHSINHPNQRLLKELASEVFEKLDLDVSKIWELDLDPLAFAQVPIHPLVADALGLTWFVEDERYRLADARLGFEEYYRLYIETFG